MTEPTLQSEPPALAPPLGYATGYAAQAPRHGTRVWAGCVILVAGLGLIVLGGCFLMGILALLTDGAAFGFKSSAGGPPTIGPAGKTLMVVLYVLAFGCFGGAATIIVATVRGLYRVVKAL